jgi:hypothetical protein
MAAASFFPFNSLNTTRYGLKNCLSSQTFLTLLSTEGLEWCMFILRQNREVRTRANQGPCITITSSTNRATRCRRTELAQNKVPCVIRCYKYSQEASICINVEEFFDEISDYQLHAKTRHLTSVDWLWQRFHIWGTQNSNSKQTTGNSNCLFRELPQSLRMHLWIVP